MKLKTGTDSSFEIRREHCHSDIVSASVLYLSDLHFKRSSASIVESLMQTITGLNPDIILLGGDYSDSASGTEHLEDLFHFLSQYKNVFAVLGNHDRSGREEIACLMENMGIEWIEHGTAYATVKGQRIAIDGNRISTHAAGSFSILCLHEPLDLNTFHQDYDLAFAGHLHGSQFVFWRSGEALYPGRLFYRWNILKKISGRCHYFISKGLGDTLPIRYNCKKDIIFVTIGSQET
ncbi:MAG: metallophosphoesterase [Bacteroidia bacterium]